MNWCGGLVLLMFLDIRGLWVVLSKFAEGWDRREVRWTWSQLFP